MYWQRGIIEERIHSYKVNQKPYQMMTFTIGIAGGTCAGKTTLANALAEQFGDRAVLLAHDAYYRDLSALPKDERAKTNFDAPEALETDLLARHLDALVAGQSVTVPIYDYVEHTRVVGEGRSIGPSPVVIVEGVLLFTEPAICELLDLSVYVEADADVRILRRIWRDVEERGRSVASVMSQYLETVKPMHERHVAPSKAQADLVVNGGGDTTKAVQLIVAHVEAALGE